MKKFIPGILIASITLIATGFAFAHSNHSDHHDSNHGEMHKDGDSHYKGHHKNGTEYRIQRLLRHLDLSEEQTSKVRAVFDKHDPQVETIRSEKEKNRQALRENMHAEKQDMATIEKLAEKHGDLKTQKILLKAKIKSEIISILNPEQREKYKNLRGKYGKHGYSKHGKHNDCKNGEWNEHHGKSRDHHKGRHHD